MIEMGLQNQYYEYILHGTKRIELRLYDDKRKEVKIGDTIVFHKSDNASFKAKVVGLLRYASFEDLFQDYPIEMLADKSMSKEELLSILEKFYPKKMQEHYGVIGIRIELI